MPRTIEVIPNNSNFKSRYIVVPVWEEEHYSITVQAENCNGQQNGVNSNPFDLYIQGNGHTFLGVSD